jgi:iron complex transport system substrate-binding protein
MKPPQLPRVWTIAGVLFASLLALGGFNDALAQGRPRQVVSLNLCADQLLLALADRDQIASLSPLSRDPHFSFLEKEARTVPVNQGRGEVILFGGADLVLTGRFGSHTKRELLQRHGLDVMVLDPWRSIAHGREQIRAVAARLGHPERGERLIAEIDEALARTKDIVPKGRTLLTFYRRGWVPSPDSVLNELVTHIGFTPHQGKLGLSRGGLARLEAIVATPPDYVLIDEVAGQNIDNGSALLVHPALNEAIPAERRLTIADNLTICAGPAIPAALDALAAEVRAKVR